MKINKNKELIHKNIEELNKELLETLREQCNMRLNNSSKKQQSHLFKIVRRNIARIKTIINIKIGLIND